MGIARHIGRTERNDVAFLNRRPNFIRILIVLLSSDGKILR
jgi:hypothetical protein